MKLILIVLRAFPAMWESLFKRYSPLPGRSFAIKIRFVVFCFGLTLVFVSALGLTLVRLNPEYFAVCKIFSTPPDYPGGLLGELLCQLPTYIPPFVGP